MWNCSQSFLKCLPCTNFTIEILKKLPGLKNDHGLRKDAMVSQMLDYRFQPEDYWIKTLQNECPYGLNQNLCALINSKVKCSHHLLGMEKDI